MTNNPLIIMALEQEAGPHFDDLPIIFCGVGKVNASYTLTKAILERNPNHIINLGSAGSSAFKVGTIVNCTSFIQRDMDVTPLGFERYVTPFEANTEAVIRYGHRHDAFPEGVCATGDSFHTDGKQEQYNVMDMEAYALAKICQKETIPFTCLKFITDGGDDEAAGDWKETLEKVSQDLSEAYRQVV